MTQDPALKHYILGNASLNNGDPHSALKEFKTALSHNSDHPAIYHNMAVAYERLNQQEKAIQYYKKTLESRLHKCSVLSKTV